jgi:hypothetical protein
VSKKKEDEISRDPHVIKQGWDITIYSNKGKKIVGIVRNIVCQKNGNWKFDIHRKTDDAFILTIEVTE